MKSAVGYSVWGLLSLLGLLLAGCAHYQLGTGGKLPFTTLYVQPVATKLLVPQAQELLSTQLRTAFNRDGRVSLVNSADATSATLIVALTVYHRDVATQRAGDSGLARKFTLTLGAKATLTDGSGRALFTDRLVEVQRDIFSDGGQIQAEYQAMPLLAQALADKLTHTVLDVW
jgi:hypothetical protein